MSVSSRRTTQAMSCVGTRPEPFGFTPKKNLRKAGQQAMGARNALAQEAAVPDQRGGLRLINNRRQRASSRWNSRYGCAAFGARLRHRSGPVARHINLCMAHHHVAVSNHHIHFCQIVQIRVWLPIRSPKVHRQPVLPALAEQPFPETSLSRFLLFFFARNSFHGAPRRRRPIRRRLFRGLRSLVRAFPECVTRIAPDRSRSRAFPPIPVHASRSAARTIMRIADHAIDHRRQVFRYADHQPPGR